MRTRLLTAVTIAALAAGTGTSIATAVGLPTPGFAHDGVAAPNGRVRYVAVSQAGKTLVKAVRRSDGRTLRQARLTGVYGVPLVAYDGAAGGLTRDGTRLVLETGPGKPVTRFAVLSTQSLSVKQSFGLLGTWGFDALSPDGRTLYLIQMLPSADTIRYLVRAYDLGLRRLVKGAIADKSEKGAMTGFPLSRVATADGVWAYTLYMRPGVQPFIHALNTRDRVAICIDLTWPGDPSNLGAVHLRLSADESRLIIRGADGTALLTVAAPR
jgi:hypothetical protein